MSLGCTIAAIAWAVAASPSPAPTPTVAPTAAPYAFSGVLTAYEVVTKGAPGFADVSDALVTIVKNAGTWRYGLTAGEYAFPTVGQPPAPTVGADSNTDLYGPVPQAYVSYNPSGPWTLSAGQLATLLGQEDGFAYQNVNIERGLGWAVEPTFSRGVRAAYASGKFVADLEFNDGYYSGSHRALEGLAGWAPSPQTSVQVAFILPNADTPGNATASIANKSEYDLMLTQSVGKLTLTPYLLVVRSPASATLNYAASERAAFASVIANYAFSQLASVAVRYEAAADGSSASDVGVNADLLGYGAGSRANTYTITPAYHIGTCILRAEYANVNATGFEQSRVVLEMGANF